MPEIWLKYGSSDVVLDIKFENILSQVSSNFHLLSEQEITDIIREINLTENTLILALSGSKTGAKVVTMLLEAARMQGFGSITIDVPVKFASALRANLNAIQGQEESVPINRIDYQSLEERMKKFQSTIIISNISYDPLFGFSGIPTKLLRNLYTDKMTEAFKARRDNMPSPGVRDKPLSIALSTIEKIQTSATSIEIVANNNGIAGIHVGNITETFNKAIEQFKSISVVDMEPARSVIISTGNESGIQSTLTDSLDSLWNSIHAIQEGGSGILLAENREGIGGGAIQMYIEGRLKVEQLYNTQYIEGLEHLIYIYELRQKYELGLVSTVPHYYANSRLGFTIYKGAKEIVDKLSQKYGRNFKSIILSEPNIIHVKPKV
jgi:hypothetical protein